MSDISKLSAKACKAGRALLDWSAKDLAREARISPNSLSALEASKDGEGKISDRTARKIVEAFERNGVELLNGDAPGARMRKGAAP